MAAGEVIGNYFGISGYDETAQQCYELLLNIDTRFRGREWPTKRNELDATNA